MPISSERNILSVPLPPLNVSLAEIQEAASYLDVTAITDTEEPSYYSATFSAQAGYYLLNYEGPRVHWQAIFKTGDEGI